MSRQGWNQAPQMMMTPDEVKELVPIIDIEKANVKKVTLALLASVCYYLSWQLNNAWFYLHKIEINLTKIQSKRFLFKLNLKLNLLKGRKTFFYYLIMTSLQKMIKLVE
jgi:hypothetical protein